MTTMIDPDQFEDEDDLKTACEAALGSLDIFIAEYDDEYSTSEKPDVD